MVESVCSTSVVNGGEGVYYLSEVTCSIYVVICSTSVDTEKKGRRTVLREQHARARERRVTTDTFATH
jgi:hypothetical protein